MSIDYDALKKRGFLRSKEDGVFTLRTRIASGNYTGEHLEAISRIAKKYGKGFTHLTVRQGIEIPFIRYEDIDAVEKEIKDVGILPGASGPRLRATTVCPGNNWCKRGIVNTFALFEKIENAGILCGLDLPHKFKIVISGCPNTCTRAQSSEIGLHGAADGKTIGYAVYLGGCGGRFPRIGFKLDKIFTEDEAIDVIKKVITFYKTHAKPRQRLALLIEQIGKESFLNAIQ
ncbi:MAG: hypothetical protein KJ706_07965 [Candidatus Omnitrophica bacterium]|nr:hypothetical protein [Candidatus Omnitrophota bacterium]MBU4589439.1 hypothetical protein [Candidatus Omnitrophota bacterium]